METAIRLHNVTKNYEKFTLDHINMDIPRGYIVGLVGENGAGKTTLLKCILQLIHADAGQIEVFGKPLGELSDDWKRDVGVILTDLGFAANMTARDMGSFMAAGYPNWQMDVYEDYLRRFDIDPGKKIKDYSKGMSMKLNLAIALSHEAQLLVLDEPTSGLDPIVRDDILDILLDFIQDETHTVLISSHITSDLEKVADYIAFLHKGKLQFCMNKDELLYEYGVIRCSREEYERIPGNLVKGVRRNAFGCEVLVSDKEAIRHKFPDLAVDDTNIEEMILFLVKGEQV